VPGPSNSLRSASPTLLRIFTGQGAIRKTLFLTFMDRKPSHGRYSGIGLSPGHAPKEARRNGPS
ncbi:MAG: hypothetical protein ACKPAH_11530, partial [Verrucomicrobiota bacterium]